MEGDHRCVCGRYNLLRVLRPVIGRISDLDVEEALALVVRAILLVAVIAQALAATFIELRQGQTVAQAWWWQQGRCERLGRLDVESASRRQPRQDSLLILVDGGVIRWCANSSRRWGLRGVPKR
jgi:hypothetical protein